MDEPAKKPYPTELDSLTVQLSAMKSRVFVGHRFKPVNPRTILTRNKVMLSTLDRSDGADESFTAEAK